MSNPSSLPDELEVTVAAPIVVARPRSAFWRARQIELQLKALEVNALNGVRSGVMKIAKATTQARGGECSALSTLSDHAFVLIARLNSLSAHFMDLEDVDLTHVMDKLDQNQTLIDELVRRLIAAGQPELATTLREALLPDRFKQADANGALFAELNECAATLLSLKCQIATSVQGEAPEGEWPPLGDDGHANGGGPVAAPSKTAASSRKRTGK